MLDHLTSLASDVGPATIVHDAIHDPMHREFLERLNGCTFHHGSVRIFGSRSEPFLDLATWNEVATWKFAWPESSDPTEYFVFGESAWGDQYAYRADPSSSEDIFILESSYLTPVHIASSFAEFLEQELLRVATKPYEPLTDEALRARGPIDASHHWAFAPAIALGGARKIANVVELPAVTAMIAGGDILRQFEEVKEGMSVVGVEPWTDEQNRARVKLISR